MAELAALTSGAQAHDKNKDTLGRDLFTKLKLGGGSYIFSIPRWQMPKSSVFLWWVLEMTGVTPELLSQYQSPTREQVLGTALLWSVAPSPLL